MELFRYYGGCFVTQTRTHPHLEVFLLGEEYRRPTSTLGPQAARGRDVNAALLNFALLGARTAVHARAPPPPRTLASGKARAPRAPSPAASLLLRVRRVRRRRLPAVRAGRAVVGRRPLGEAS